MSGEAESADKEIVKMYPSIKVNVFQDFHFKGGSKTPGFKATEALLIVMLGKSPEKLNCLCFYCYCYCWCFGYKIS